MRPRAPLTTPRCCAMFLVTTATMPMQHQKDGGHLTSVVFQEAYVSTMSGLRLAELRIRRQGTAP